jgi:small subunit ribosomal protein S2
MKKEELLVPREKYLSSGVHIGMTFKTKDMKRFIYKIRPGGLAVLDISLLDKRIRHAANILSKFKNILVVSRKDVAQKAVESFANAVGAKPVIGRFMPGSLTNPSYKEFFEPDILIVTDPSIDRQAMKESIQKRIPIIALADTFNETSYIDLILPCNNKGRKSIAFVYWLLAREILKVRGEEPKLKLEDFGWE